jgi:hypothetical protein
MPAFTFEKISPPATPQRDNVIQVLGRFVEARVRDDERTDQPPPRQPLPK